ncbi:hypothetical protein B0H15DRAFT_923722 [Mycena belliarum]|uniref:Hemerythrin-like domain-containing protein n=1 Tax=Mycena belliarum TaxID=1033014 RepID=A0AAD6TZ99_9AGAR|nr:hypothetical protein B0H15DRAFT_923722 [Mycena belliae]
MASFHNWFKQECPCYYTHRMSRLADGSFTKRGLNLGLYLEMSKRLNSHLTMHHTIEERHIFPILAKRMPQFSTETEAGHIDSHKGIHEGMEQLGALVVKFKMEPSSYSPAEMRACLDGFRDVLFRHLDEEVEDLRGENMKKYWTLEELESIPI